MSSSDDNLMLEAYRGSFEAGNRFSLFDAINRCARHDVRLPRWVAEEFMSAYKKIRNFEATSLDDAFGKPHPEGLHIAKAAFKKARQYDVYVAIRHMHVKGKRPIDNELFDEVGEKFGIGRTVCKELYSEVKNPLGRKRAPRKRREKRKTSGVTR